MTKLKMWTMVFDSVLRVIDGMVELLPDFSPPIALPHVTKTLLKHVRVPYQSIIFYRKGCLISY